MAAWNFKPGTHVPGAISQIKYLAGCSLHILLCIVAHWCCTLLIIGSYRIVTYVSLFNHVSCSSRRSLLILVQCLPLSCACLCSRLILFLQQSSVEWASSLWLKVVQEVDPNFTRTVRQSCTVDAQLLLSVPDTRWLPPHFVTSMPGGIF